MSRLPTKPAKRGRQTKAQKAIEQAALEAMRAAEPLTDKEMLEMTKTSFSVYANMVDSLARNNMKAVIVNGGPGTGKSHTGRERLSLSGSRYREIKGSISPVNLYKEGFRFRHGGTLMIDDADDCIQNEESLNILKALMDKNGNVDWLKESHALMDEELGMVDKSYVFNGNILIISNLDLQAYVDAGPTHKIARHIEAVLSRAHSVDLHLHSRRAKFVWLRHIATDGTLFKQEDVSLAQGKTVLKFLEENLDHLKNVDIRTLTKACELIRDQKLGKFEDVARSTLCSARR